MTRVKRPRNRRPVPKPTQSMDREARLGESPAPFQTAAPRQQAVWAMRTLINSLPEGRERSYAVEACIGLSYRLWGWNVERFRDELAQAVLLRG